MKKQNIILYGLLIIFSLVVLTGCGNTNNTIDVKEELVGMWNLTLETEGVYGKTLFFATYSFKENGEFYYSNSMILQGEEITLADEKGEYTIDEAQSIIKLDFEDDDTGLITEIPYSIENGEFIFNKVLEDGTRYIKNDKKVIDEGFEIGKYILDSDKFEGYYEVTEENKRNNTVDWHLKISNKVSNATYEYSLEKISDFLYKVHFKNVKSDFEFDGTYNSIEGEITDDTGTYKLKH